MSEDKVGYELTLNKKRIDEVVRLTTGIVAQEISGIHPAEALFGFAEVVGRVIAAQEGSYNVHNDLINHAVRHIKDTVKASYSAKGQNPGGIK